MVPQPQASPLIAGSVLPIRRAEELLKTLPGVQTVRIVASDTGAVEAIHVLTTSEVTGKQTVRNVETALIAHLGMRVDHRKISVATSVAPRKAVEEPPAAPAPHEAAGASRATPASPGASTAQVASRSREAAQQAGGRQFYFEDVEVRRSRSKGLTCRVTLVKGDKSYVGEAEGMENERSRMELAGRAALRAIGEAVPGLRPLDLSGAQVVEAFDREFVFVGVTAQLARETAVFSGSCEVKDSAETAAVLAVLDATNRWLLQPREGGR